MSSHAKKYILLLAFLFSSLSCQAIAGDKSGLPSQQPSEWLLSHKKPALRISPYKQIGILWVEFDYKPPLAQSCCVAQFTP
jgi:hypothetical protein